MVIYTSAWPPVPIAEGSIFSHVFNSKRCAPGQVVYIDGPTGRQLTKANVKHAALSLAHGLRNELHTPKFRGPSLSRGDTVMIFSQNNILYPVFMWGIFAAGLCATLAPNTASPNEVRGQWTDSRSKVIIVSSSLVHAALDVFKLANFNPEDALRRMIVYSDGEDVQLPEGFKFTRYEDLSAQGLLPKEEPFGGPLSNQTALLCYSSGTTGKPKGVQVNPACYARSPLSSTNRMLTLPTLDHTQEPHSAIGRTPVDRNSRIAHPVDDLPRPLLSYVWGSKLLNDANLSRR